MLGVDKLDQLMSYYSFLHKSIKWWRKVFFWMLEVSIVNSYIIYKELAKSRRAPVMPQLAYRRKLILSLSAPVRMAVIPRQVRHASRLERLRSTHFLAKGTKRRDCVVCSNRGSDGSRHLSLYHCATCSTNPALCPSGCFEAYHTKINYKL